VHSLPTCSEFRMERSISLKSCRGLWKYQRKVKALRKGFKGTRILSNWHQLRVESGWLLGWLGFLINIKSQVVASPLDLIPSQEHTSYLVPASPAPCRMWMSISFLSTLCPAWNYFDGGKTLLPNHLVIHLPPSPLQFQLINSEALINPRASPLSF